MREAIRAEEEEQAARAALENSQGKSRKRNRNKKGSNDMGERIDGRAGPKSENVVLQKSKH